MKKTSKKLQARLKRKKRIRKRLLGTFERPRLSVFRTAKHIYAQIIDDEKGITLVSASTLDKELRDNFAGLRDKKEIAKRVGALLAIKAKTSGITKIAFDRNGYLYHGRVKALAESARENGLDF
ncbi:MAG: 50S ribosomal protein L18 [Dissulfurimicrobium sp.]|uniref:50S ribosomal protein L18 n=1 Tax=Dissulfurimicrobium sp. TaxID=2022436 RepID=UPI00404B623D